ncbi:MAG: hypothetical protein JXA30_02690 [Deltaproteobacteria bacterium]|nr:hypothetical protein [Deltaproteobacteria bacterium]
MKNKLILALFIIWSVGASVGFAQTEAEQAATEDQSSAGSETTAEPSVSECVPKCREGYVCSEQKCVSICNPPCAPGQTCTSLGHCVTPGSADTTASEGTVVPLMVPEQKQSHPELGPGDPGWATEAGIIGLVGAAAVVGLTAGSAYKHGEPASAYLGIGAMGTLAVAGPIVAIGALSARSNPIHRGYPVVYTFSWIGYGVSLIYGTALLVDGMENDGVKPGWIAGAGVIGTLSLVGFSIDAFVSAIQAESPVGQLGKVRQQPSLKPRISLSPEINGGMAASLGLTGSF